MPKMVVVATKVFKIVGEGILKAIYPCSFKVLKYTGSNISLKYSNR